MPTNRSASPSRPADTRRQPGLVPGVILRPVGVIDEDVLGEGIDGGGIVGPVGSIDGS